MGALPSHRRAVCLTSVGKPGLRRDSELCKEQGLVAGEASRASMGKQCVNVLNESIRKRIIFDVTICLRKSGEVVMAGEKVPGMHDVDAMLEVCREIENAYFSQPKDKFRGAPAPYYFLRAAILCRKRHDYSGEVAICERWIALANDYSSQQKVKDGWAANVAAGGSSADIVKRLPKARELMEKAGQK